MFTKLFHKKHVIMYMLPKRNSIGRAEDQLGHLL